MTIRKKYHVTNFYGVPTIYSRFLGLNALEEKLKTIRYCFSAATSLPMEVVREWHARTGQKIFEAYGMTESAVVGVPDKEYGERVTAFVVNKNGHQPDKVKLKAYLKNQLSGFKVPKEFITVESLPKSSTGKLLKRDLKKNCG